MKTFKFKHWNVVPEMKQYVDGNPAMRLIDPNEPFDNLIAVATVNLPGLKKDEVAIKDYGENAGMYQTLLDNDLITPAHRYEQSGYIEIIPVCYLKIPKN